MNITGIKTFICHAYRTNWVFIKYLPILMVCMFLVMPMKLFQDLKNTGPFEGKINESGSLIIFIHRPEVGP